MRAFGVIFGAWLLALQAATAAAPDFWTVVPSREIDGCKTLDACLAILDRLPKTPFGATTADDPKVAAYLKRFGMPARQALLERAGRSDPGWSNYAGALLMAWTDFTPADVPALIKALKRQPGGWIARALGQVATPPAIAALVEDVREHGAQSQSGWALKTVGVKAVPYLMPLLEDDKKWNDGASILTEMGGAIVNLAPGWSALALDAAQPVAKRVAALRALGAIHPRVTAQGPRLRPLLKDGDEQVRAAAEEALRDLGDASTLEAMFAACQPALENGAPEPFSSLHFNAWCLEKIAATGAQAKPLGPAIAARFLTSPNGADRNIAAGALGYIGDETAIPKLIALLGDPDWRVAYAAARSLGWLHATAAAPALAKLAANHWLADVRAMAQAALDSLKPGAAPLDRPPLRDFGSMPPAVPLEVEATLAPDVAPCASAQWRYGGVLFGEPQKRRESVTGGALGSGLFSVEDEGEWGGGLFWRPPGGDLGRAVLAINSQGVELSSTGAVAAFGELGEFAAYNPKAPDQPQHFGGNAPSGVGFVVSFTHGGGGSWDMKEIARLPRAPDVMTTIGPDLFVAWSGGRAIVFSLQGIEGVAACVP